MRGGRQEAQPGTSACRRLMTKQGKAKYAETYLHFPIAKQSCWLKDCKRTRQALWMSHSLSSNIDIAKKRNKHSPQRQNTPCRRAHSLKDSRNWDLPSGISYLHVTAANQEIKHHCCIPVQATQFRYHQPTTLLSTQPCCSCQSILAKCHALHCLQSQHFNFTLTFTLLIPQLQHLCLNALSFPVSGRALSPALSCHQAPCFAHPTFPTAIINPSRGGTVPLTRTLRAPPIPAAIQRWNTEDAAQDNSYKLTPTAKCVFP